MNLDVLSSIIKKIAVVIITINNSTTISYSKIIFLCWLAIVKIFNSFIIFECQPQSPFDNINFVLFMWQTLKDLNNSLKYLHFCLLTSCFTLCFIGLGFYLM